MAVNDINFKIANIKAKEQLVKLWVDTFTDAYKDLHSFENILTYCSKHFNLSTAEKILTNDLYVCTMATRADRNVGVSILHHTGCPLRPEVKASELKQLYLVASEYGTGLGMLMIEKEFEQVRKTGNDWIWLCVSDLNLRARRFYRKVGFDVIGKGPVLEVGTDRLPSSIMIRSV